VLLLATAQGPLKRTELRQVLDNKKLDGLALRDEILPVLRRFARGDGNEVGFSLQHLRFRVSSVNAS